MKVLLRWLIEHAWIFYTVCIIGAIIYLARALSAHRERDLALFTLERETATARAVRAWAMFLVFVIVGFITFISVSFVLPEESIYNPESPLPTATPRSGLEPPTPGDTITPTQPLPLPTLTPLTTPEATVAPTSSPEPAETPTSTPTQAPTPTATPGAAVSGDMQVRFGDFAVLVGYSLSSAEITTSDPPQLTLYWQGTGNTSPMDYLVFTHLLSEDGRLIAQHDGAPANGTRPTTTWKAGETITDLHPMAFKPEAADYTGPATLAVGLYDPNNPSSRVSTSEGRDYAVLPITINVVSP